MEDPTDPSKLTPETLKAYQITPEAVPPVPKGWSAVLIREDLMRRRSHEAMEWLEGRGAGLAELTFDSAFGRWRVSVEGCKFTFSDQPEDGGLVEATLRAKAWWGAQKAQHSQHTCPTCREALDKSVKKAWQHGVVGKALLTGFLIQQLDKDFQWQQRQHDAWWVLQYGGLTNDQAYERLSEHQEIDESAGHVLRDEVPVDLG